MSDNIRLSKTILELEEMLDNIVSLQEQAYELRQEAIIKAKKSDELVNEAKSLEKGILDYAVGSLGEKQGRLAYSLVLGNYSDQFELPDYDAAEKSLDGKVDLYGVSVLLRNKEEADLVIETALDKAVIENPYAKDRGKNAWRRMLFEAVRDEHAEEMQLDPVLAPTDTVEVSEPELDDMDGYVDHDLEATHYAVGYSQTIVYGEDPQNSKEVSLPEDESESEKLIDPDPVENSPLANLKLPSFLKDL